MKEGTVWNGYGHKKIFIGWLENKLGEIDTEKNNRTRDSERWQLHRGVSISQIIFKLDINRVNDLDNFAWRHR